MNSRKFVLLFIIIIAFGSASQGQIKKDPFHDEFGNTYHQLFLDFQATEIIELKYSTDPSPVEGELSVDGYSIVIKNYPGEQSVIVKVRDVNGVEKEVTRGRCFIDPVLLEI